MAFEAIRRQDRTNLALEERHVLTAQFRRSLSSGPVAASRHRPDGLPSNI
jgi:hypothetical protein